MRMLDQSPAFDEKSEPPLWRVIDNPHPLLFKRLLQPTNGR